MRRAAPWLAGVMLLAIAASAGAAPPRKPAASPPPPAPTAPAVPPAPTAPMAAPGIIYTMETLQTGQLPPDVIEKLKPLNTLPEIEALLKANRITFSWRMSEAPSATIPAALAEQFDAKPHEVFVLPQRGGVVFVAIINRRPV